MEMGHNLHSAVTKQTQESKESCVALKRAKLKENPGVRSCLQKWKLLKRETNLFSLALVFPLPQPSLALVSFVPVPGSTCMSLFLQDQHSTSWVRLHGLHRRVRQRVC